VGNTTIYLADIPKEPPMNEQRLREILAEALEQSEGLPENAAEQITKIRTGALSNGLQAAINAMKRAITEDRANG
jgi:hypothetical protein